MWLMRPKSHVGMPQAKRGTCSTCKRCRQKKVKCGGQLPECDTCCLKNQRCEYPQDGRKTAVRAKKHDIHHLQKQIKELKEQTGRSSSTKNVPDADHPISCPQDPRISTPRLGRHSELSMVPSDHDSTTLQQEEQMNLVLPNESENDQSFSNQVLEQNDSSTPLESLERLNGCEIQAYGVMSLRRGCEDSWLQRTQSRRDGEGYMPRTYSRDQLISFAAITKQKESMLYSTPSIAAHIDFDGVSMDMAMHLMDLHWNRLHLMYLLTYRPAFMDSLMNNGPYVNKLLINAIYLQSSLYSDRKSLRSNPEEPQSTGMAFYERFKSLLVHYIDKPSLPTVVALLTCGACLVQYGKQSAGWMFCGMAYRMILDLGYHIESDTTPHRGEGSNISALEKEIRRRVYWGAYATDKSQSLYLGQCPALYLREGNVPREFNDSFEELEEWKPYIDPCAQLQSTATPAYPGRPSYAISTFESLLQLSIITETIISAFYSTKSANENFHTLLRTREQIQAQLDRWRSSLPSHLLFDPNAECTSPPHQITLFTTYWTLVILAEQPFLMRSDVCVDRGLHDSLQEEAKKKCLEAAFNIRALIGAYKKAFTLRRAQFGISYAMYSAVLVLLQHGSQYCEEYVEACQFFWSALLEYQRGCGHGLKKPLLLLKSLMLRVEKLASCMDASNSGANSRHNFDGINIGDGPISDIEAFGESGMEVLCGSVLDLGAEDLSLVDNTMFGFFTDGVMG